MLRCEHGRTMVNSHKPHHQIITFTPGHSFCCTAHGSRISAQISSIHQAHSSTAYGLPTSNAQRKPWAVFRPPQFSCHFPPVSTLLQPFPSSFRKGFTYAASPCGTSQKESDPLLCLTLPKAIEKIDLKLSTTRVRSPAIRWIMQQILFIPTNLPPFTRLSFTVCITEPTNGTPGIIFERPYHAPKSQRVHRHVKNPNF